jgi:D-alanyl-lipoteichoic acid acyltransferase DltB (MBOAT superfamily)
MGMDYPIQAARIILPIGLSFHTFQSLAYVIEVYRGKQKAERDFGIYALYVMFYPQLVAGPIERPQNLLWQFRMHHEFDYDRVVRGLQLMAFGFFKKVVIADRLSVMVNQVYNSPAEHNGIQAAIATIFFAYQIYCDFSGYSDIAIGAAQVMGFKLMKNFDRPYYSKSISEFWRRWHISLSTWFRDYFYISLGGNRVSIPRWYLNLFLTFVVSGLWHGANWTFVIWGGLHGYYLVFSIITKSAREKAKNILGISKIKWLENTLAVISVFILADFAWIFFRAASVGDAFIVIDRIFRDGWAFLQHLFGGDRAYVSNVIRTLGFDKDEVTLVLVCIAALEFVQLWQRRGSVRDALYRKPVWLRWGLYYVLLAGILWLGFFGQEVQFIYFQF